MSAPRISIIVPALEGTTDVDATVRSVEEQRYPHVEVLVEQGDGFGAALDRGFARATGDIRAFVAAGDALLPGTLARAAAEVAPAQGRRVVMGGAVFEIEGVDDAVVRHPAEYAGFAEHLRIWDRGWDLMAYSSLFWHRDVQPDVGSLAAFAQPAVAAYALSCGIARRHAIHKVDEAWSACRLDGSPGASTERDILAACVEVSRRHWGGWLSPLRWRCELSYRRHAAHRYDRARHHARRAETARSSGDRATYLIEAFQAFRYAPRMARERLRRGGG